MKRFIFLMLGILCSTIVWCADGDTFTANTIEGIEMSFRVIKEDDKTCEVYAYTETTGNKTIIHQAVDKDYSGDITIPSVVNGYSVIGLSDYAFSYTNISLINIPTGVMYIGNKAFEGCIFQSITLPEGLKNIGSNAFMSCKNLESINIPQSVETIGFGAFVYCSSMEIINLPSGNLKNMGGGVFQGCKKIKKLDIPEGVTSIGKKDSGTSFIWNCKELESITLPSTLLSINEELLGECPSLSKIIVKMTDPTILNIESSSLIYVYDSPSIYETARLYVPNGSKAAYQVADYWKDFNEIIEFLPIITFADANVKAICVANWDTDGDGELSEAEAAAVTDLGQVFKNNTQITSFEELHFFTGLTSIGTEAFYGCTNLSTVTMPNSITSIGNLAFWSCRKITTILIPNNVTSIGKNAFTRCIGLTSVTIPDGLLSIEEGAFISCDNLISFNIPNSVSSIGNGAFSGTAWLDNQPDGLLYVGNFLYGYKGLIPENSVLEIKEGTKGIVDQALYGGSNISSITLPNSIVYIGKRAFQECSGISSIIIPNSVTTIGEGAFYCCTNLASITISNSLTSIEDNTFVSCSGLTSVTIPNSVTNIGKNAFASCDNLSSLEMPNSVTSIGIGAFKYCTSLTFVDIPNSVISINGSTFEGCASLLSVAIPSSITSIGSCAFSDCNNLTSIVIPKSVTSIGDYAFSGCNELITVTIEKETPITINSYTFTNRKKATLYVPKGAKSAYVVADYWKEFKDIIELSPKIAFADANVKAICVANWDTDNDGELSEAEAAAVTDLGTVFQINGSIISFNELQYFTGLTSIGDETFNNCWSLTSVIIPQNVTSIGKHAFDGCEAFTSFTFPESVKSIDDYAFFGCIGLTSITIPDNVSSIGQKAFSDCTNLSSVTIGDGVTSIGEAAFWTCIGLTSVTIGNSVESIGKWVFANCYALSSVTIPQSVTSIGVNPFQNCNNITSIIVDNGNPAYDSRDNCNAIIETATNNLISGCKNTVIPNSVTSIGERAFMGCDLTSISIPENVKSLGERAFSDCNNLTSVTVKRNTPATVGSYCFTNSANITLYVPAGSKDAYSTYWKGFKEIVELSPTITFADTNVKSLCVINWDTDGDGELSEDEAAAVTDLGQVFKENTQITSFDELQYFTGLASIKESAFLGCSDLVSINLPENITAISSGAFKGCKSLKTVVVPNNVTIIGDYAFDSCSGLTSIEISNSVKEIGEQTFWDCTSLKSINLPEGLTIIKKGILRGCSSLTSITIPSTVTTIEDSAFSGCSSLTNLEIPDNVISLGENAFKDCTGLLSVKIGDGVTTIGNRAFRVCNAMTTLTLGKSVKEIGAEAFLGSQSLTDVFCYAEIVPAASSAFDETLLKDVTLHVPNVSLDAYKKDDCWKEFKFIVGLDDLVTESDCIYSDGLSIYQGYLANLEVKLINENAFTAYQFDLVLPEGIVLATDENGKYLVSKSDRYSDNAQQVKVEKHDNNTYRIMSFSMLNGIINGNDGVILTITLKADEEITVGNTNAEIRDIVLTLSDETKIKTKPVTFSIEVKKRLKGDADGDGEIDVTDIVAMINYIMGQPSEKFVMPAADINDDGEVDIFDVMKAINLVMTQKKSARIMARTSRETEEQASVTAVADGIVLGINDASRFTAFQFNVEVDDDTELNDVRLTANVGNHKLYFIKNGQNTYKVVGISIDNSTLSADGNGLIELSFSKVGNVRISDIVFVTPQETKIYFASSDATVTGVDGIESEQAEDIFDLSGRKIDTNRSRLPKGIYIINNKKVVIK